MKTRTKKKIKGIAEKAAIMPITVFTLANIAGMHQLPVVPPVSNPTQTFLAAPGATFLRQATSGKVFQNVTARIVDTTELTWATSGTVWGHIMIEGGDAIG